jgi:hypothetical protein
MFENTKLIHSYSRAEAIEDGVLVDVSATAREAGIKFPVALTRSVWDAYVTVPENIEAQDEAGRLWDILFLLSFNIRRAKGATSTIHYSLRVRTGKGPRRVRLKAICGPGDKAEPTITVLLPEED